MRIELETIYGILIPFLGTSLGAGCVFLMRKTFDETVQKLLNGFAAGVMMAASVWSLLIPAMEQSAKLENYAFVPAVTGMWAGILFLLFLDKRMPQVLMTCARRREREPGRRKAAMVVLAVTVHNIPEGMAVGVAFAGWLSNRTSMTMAGVFALAVGIAVQNFPEGAIISLPLRGEGMSGKKAFACGVLSGAVEPAAAVVTICATGFIVPLLPYLLSFAAGAMLYVVVAELRNDMGILFFFAGFSVMMILDVALR